MQDPLALRLEVGLPGDVALLDQHDLDNYVFPLIMRLSKTSGRQFASVWAAKSHKEDSGVVVQQAVPRLTPVKAGSWLQVRTSASSSTAAYKEQIAAQVEGVALCRMDRSCWSWPSPSDRGATGRTCGSPRSTHSTVFSVARQMVVAGTLGIAA